MNTLLFRRHELNSHGILTLGAEEIDPRAEHIKKVLKAESGSTLRVGEIGGHLGKGIIRSVAHGDHTCVQIEIESLSTSPPQKLPFHVVLALPRPKGLRRVLRGLANMGVDSIDLIQSYRVDKSYWSAPTLMPEKLEAALLEGLSIANDTILPRVQLFRRFKPYVQDVAANFAFEHMYLAHPRKESEAVFAVPRRPLSISKSVALAIGPEGGWTEYEVGMFTDSGFKLYSFGNRVLSVEMALPILSTALFFDLHRITR
jgi:16S rRNA (uracil1498-N3)-methyltransferase